MGKGTQPKTDRNKELFRLHEEEGMSYNDLAKKFDLTVQRVWQIIKREREKQN